MSFTWSKVAKAFFKRIVVRASGSSRRATPKAAAMAVIRSTHSTAAMVTRERSPVTRATLDPIVPDPVVQGAAILRSDISPRSLHVNCQSSYAVKSTNRFIRRPNGASRRLLPPLAVRHGAGSERTAARVPVAARRRAAVELGAGRGPAVLSVAVAAHASPRGMVAGSRHEESRER
jgi:hypothetical protein